MGITLVEYFSKKIENKINELSNYYIEIGVFSAETNRKEKVKLNLNGSIENEGVTNAQLMYIHEKGSPIRNIPRRPVLEMTLDWVKKNNLITTTVTKALAKYIQSNFKENLFETYLERLCVRMENYAKNIIYSNDGRLAPNSPTTIKRKGSDAPLLDTGQLARSITCRLLKYNIKRR